jgi:hypothetical protein
MSKYRYDKSWLTVRVGRTKDLFTSARRCSCQGSRRSWEEFVLQKLRQRGRPLHGQRTDLGGLSAEIAHPGGNPLSPGAFEMVPRAGSAQQQILSLPGTGGA